MKLELRHLAPYLPYKLIFLDIADNEVYELNALYDNGDAFNWDSGEVDLELIKPLLRPLTDLTKEIEHNGKRFIPMQSICRDCFYNEQYQKDWIFGERNGVYYASAVDPVMTRLFEYNSKVMFFIGSNPRDSEIKNVEQYSAFQKLFEYHFDIFGLIDKNLAIDLNTIEQ